MTDTASQTPYEDWLGRESKVDALRLPTLLARATRKPYGAYAIAGTAALVEVAYLAGHTLDMPSLPAWTESIAIALAGIALVAAGIELWFRKNARTELAHQIKEFDSLVPLADLLGAGFRGEEQNGLPEALVRVAVNTKNGRKLQWPEQRTYVTGVRRGFARMRELQIRYEFRQMVGDMLMLPPPSPTPTDETSSA